MLSNVNIAMAVGLLVFVLVTGATLFLLRGMVETLGLYLSNLPRLAFWNDMLHGGEMDTGEWGWQGDWTVFYWTWTVTWSPFIGLFVARISRGRTIREFVSGVLLAPSLFTVIWFAIFGWQAIALDGLGTGARAAMGPEAGAISAAVTAPIPRATFAFFEQLPWAPVMQGIAVLVVAILFATSSDSASPVVDMPCSGTARPGPVRQRVFRGLAEGMIAATLILLAGEAGLTALQEVITVVGLPIFLLVFMMIPALIRGFGAEDIDHVTIGQRPALREFANPEEDAAPATPEPADTN